MNHRTRLAAALALGGALAATDLGVPGPARADIIDDEIKSFEDYMKTSPAPDGICNKIADLSTKRNPKVAACLLKLNLLRHQDDKVVITTAQAIGKQDDPKVASILEAMADAKELRKEKKWKIMAALVEGVGDADAKGHYKFLIDTGKKYMDINGDVACAAFRAVGNHVTNETVDDLVSELQRADYTTTKDSAEKRAARGAAKPVIIETLKKVTGKEIADVKVWKEWWDNNKKTWKPPVPGKEGTVDINASDTFTEDAYGIVIKKANKAWTFRKNEGGGHGILTIEALDEGQRAAWIEISAEGTKNLKSKTPEAYADELKGNIEPKFRDIKSADWTKKCVYGGLKGIEQVVDGQHKDHDVVHMHNVFVEKGEVMYAFQTFWKSGKKPSLKDDIEKMLDSFQCKR